MARVFIDLPVAPQPLLNPPEEESGPVVNFVEGILQAGEQRLAPSETEFSLSRSSEAGPPPGRFVLIGGPGQGKTTVSQFLCQLYRASILSARDSSSFAPEVRQILAGIDSHCKADKTQLPGCRRFPIRVVLNHFARDLDSTQTGSANSLLSYIVKRIRTRTDQDILAEDLRTWLRCYPWLLILDGLDEVPPSSNRTDVISAIQEFWIDATENNADILVLATTRPQGYQAEFSPGLYRHSYLTPLPTKRAMVYAKRLASARYGNDRDREQRIVSRLERASRDLSTARLMRSPLQVTIMATLVDQTGQPPQERWRLFHEYYEVIYKREMEREIPAAVVLREHKSNIDGIHHQVGLALQIESERRGLREAHLSKVQFGSVVSTRLSSEGYVGNQLMELRELIMEAAMNRLVFLVGVEANEVGFEIRSLQEFMAAEALMDGKDAVVIARLNAIACITNWRNVFLFCAGKCFAVKQHLRDVVLSICVTLNDQADDEMVRQALVGSQLALDVLADGTAHRQPIYERSLTRAALRLADRPGSALLSMLADVYQESMEDIFAEELGRRLCAATTPRSMYAWQVILGLVDRKVPWAMELAEDKWPANAREQDEILEQRYAIEQFPRRTSAWAQTKVVSLFPGIPIDEVWKYTLMMHEPSPDLAKAWAAISALATGRGDGWFVAEWRPDERGSASMLGLRLCRVLGQPDYWAQLESKPVGPSDWSMLYSARPFCTNPTAKTLGEALKGISEVLAPKALKTVAHCVPWPLAVCLESATSCSDLIRLATEAESGSLGDIADWARAEERWMRGITMADVTAFDLNGCRLGPYLADEGYPFGSAFPWAYTGISDRFLEVLVPKLSEVRHPRLRTSLATIVADVIMLHGFEGRARDWLTADDLKTVWDICERDSIYLTALCLLPNKGYSSSACIALLDHIGRRRTLVLSGEGKMPDLGDVVAEAFRRQPSMIGLLPLIAVCSAGSGNYNFELRAIDPAQYAEPRLRSAAFVLTLRQCTEVAMARDLAAKITETLANMDEDLFEAAIGLVTKGRIPLMVGSAFLMELLKLLPATENRDMASAMTGVDDVLGQRRSMLGDLSTRATLELKDITA